MKIINFIALSLLLAALQSVAASAGNKSIVVDGYQIKKAAMNGSCFELVLANQGGRARSGLLTLVWGSAKNGYVTREPFSMAGNSRHAARGCFEPKRARTPNPALKDKAVSTYITGTPALMEANQLHILIDGKLARSMKY